MAARQSNDSQHSNSSPFPDGGDDAQIESSNLERITVSMQLGVERTRPSPNAPSYLQGGYRTWDDRSNTPHRSFHDPLHHAAAAAQIAMERTRASNNLPNQLRGGGRGPPDQPSRDPLHLPVAAAQTTVEKTWPLESPQSQRPGEYRVGNGRPFFTRHPARDTLHRPVATSQTTPTRWRITPRNPPHAEERPTSDTPFRNPAAQHYLRQRRCALQCTPVNQPNVPPNPGLFSRWEHPPPASEPPNGVLSPSSSTPRPVISNSGSERTMPGAWEDSRSPSPSSRTSSRASPRTPSASSTYTISSRSTSPTYSSTASPSANSFPGPSPNSPSSAPSTPPPLYTRVSPPPPTYDELAWVSIQNNRSTHISSRAPLPAPQLRDNPHPRGNPTRHTETEIHIFSPIRRARLPGQPMERSGRHPGALYAPP